MWRSFVILFIVTTNLCTLLDSYKIINDRSSKTIQSHDQQDSSNLPEEYVEENYSNEDSYKQSSGRVVIGKWRNNGEALEPKWRDGDSVPLAPFSTISFKNEWRKDPADSREEDYQIEPESFNENGMKNLRVSLADQDFASTEPEEIRENYHLNGEQRVGYKNVHRKDRQFNRPTDINDKNENSPQRMRPAAEKLSGTFKEVQLREDGNVDEKIQGLVKYRETLPNYPSEYELYENENDNPRPRKRRPPQHYEFPGSWISDENRREESSFADNKQGRIEQNKSPGMASDVQRYLVASQDAKSTNQTRAQENTELKTFLKMQGETLSLSEILQQKNLTLADLLKGKPNAIKILKSNEKRIESAQEEDTATEPMDENSTDSTSENPSWSTPRRMMIRRLNKNSSFESENDATIVNFGKTNSDFETTTSLIGTTTLKKIEEIVDDVESPYDTTEFITDNETVSGEKFEHVNPSDGEKSKSESEEFLKPLENRESLSTEATTTMVVEDGTAAGYSVNKQNAGVSNDRFVPVINNNDDDEIMEFSDYPAAKMPKFVPPMLHKTVSLNPKRKHIPFSAIRTTIKPSDDPELKLSIENILSSENKASRNVNDTHNVNENYRKIANEMGVKSIDTMMTKDQDGVSERMKNETDGIKSPEEKNTNSKPEEFENRVKSKKNEKESEEEDGEKIFAKDVDDDSIQSSEESNTGFYGHPTLPQDHKNLALNHKLHEVVIPKVDPQSRAEILELFSSGSSAERLERLLASRNMTIEELIALRQRGSSQVHFAEVFKSKEQVSTPLPQNYKTDYQIPDNYKENEQNQLSETTEKINPLKKNNNSSDIENIENFQGNENTTGNKKKETFYKDGDYLAADLLNKIWGKNATAVKIKRVSNTSVEIPDINSRTGIELKKSVDNSDLTSMLEAYPAGNNIHKDSEGSSYYTSIEAVKLPADENEKKIIPDIFEEAKIAVIKSVTSEEIGRVEEILNNDLKSIKNTYGMNDYEFTEKKALSKVKPSIIASGGILGVTIVVFLSIFIACRIQQKKKFAYKNSFAKAVFHNPVMTARKLSNTSSINTIMVDVVATSTTKRPQKHDPYEGDDFESKSDIDNDSLNANDSWETIPDFMK